MTENLTIIIDPAAVIPTLELPAPFGSETPPLPPEAYDYATVALAALCMGDEQRRLKEEAQYEATHDSLTGLLNRQGLNEYLLSNPTPQAVLYLDSTNFKAVNDNISHDRGDQLLVETARILQGATRSSDAIARDGGDEFVIILDNFEQRSAEQLTRGVGQIRERIENSVSEFLALPENADLVAQGYGMAVGSAIRESGLSYNQLKDIAERGMKQHKAQQHEDLGQYRTPPAN